MWLDRLFCFVHEDRKRCDPETGRVFLRCEKCGRETKGWTCEAKPLAFQRSWRAYGRLVRIRKPRTAA